METRYVDPFWIRVKKLIRANKISQEKFAASIDLSYNTFKSWLSFNRIPDAYTTCAMAHALGVSVEYLVEGTDCKTIEIQKKEIYIRKTAAKEIKKMAFLINKNAGLIR